MKKVYSILSIIALCLAALSLLLAVAFATIFWKPICTLMYGAEFAQFGPTLPLGTMASIVGALAVSALLVLTAKSKTGILVELLSILLIIIVMPAIATVLNTVQTTILGNTTDSLALTAASISRGFIGYASALSSVATSLCLVVCGMRISAK